MKLVENTPCAERFIELEKAFKELIDARKPLSVVEQSQRYLGSRNRRPKALLRLVKTSEF